MPTKRLPSFVYATIEGVVLAPSLLGITFGWPPSMKATTELVVPKSIPIIFAIFHPFGCVFVLLFGILFHSNFGGKSYDVCSWCHLFMLFLSSFYMITKKYCLSITSS